MFALRLRELREERHLSQVQVAQAIGVSERGYQNLEATAKPHYDTLLKIADYFNVSVDWLMGRTEKREVGR